MKSFRSVVLFGVICLALVLTPAWARAQESLNAMLQPYLARHGLPALAAAVAKGGQIVAAGAVGTRRAGQDIPVTLGDRFHIGSDTKAMTALLAGMLVEEGKLRWNSNPAEVFPELAPEMDPGFATVTLEQLLSHSSGVPADNAEVVAVLKEGIFQDGNLNHMRAFVVRQWSKKPLASPPGSQFRYSNMGYLIAGAMIERAAGITWDELIVARLFLPLGLTTAGLGCQSTLGRVDAPLGHVMINGQAQALLAGPNGDNMTILGPAGIAHMSITDFARWAAWNAGEGRRGPALVKPETLRRLHTPIVSTDPPSPDRPAADSSQARDGYSLGWSVVHVGSVPHPLLQHNGSNNMNLAQVWVDVENDLAIVLATNIAGQGAKDAFSSLMRVLYPKYAAR